MTKQEFAVFVSMMRTYYGRENLLPNNQAMELWFRQLEDIPYGVAEAGLNKWVATNRWSPSIADIRAMAADVKGGEAPDWSEAWEKVLKIVGRYGLSRQIEAMEAMDDLTRQAVRRVGWYDICMSENIGVERANFRDIYNNLAERQKKEAVLPPKVSQMIAKVRENLKLLQGE